MRGNKSISQPDIVVDQRADFTAMLEVRESGNKSGMIKVLLEHKQLGIGAYGTENSQLERINHVGDAMN